MSRNRIDGMNNNNNTNNNDEGEETQSSSHHLPRQMQLRNRAVAEREASRLARPEKPNNSIHQNSIYYKKSTSVSSTPSGFETYRHNHNNSKKLKTINSTSNDCVEDSIVIQQDASPYSNEHQEWCGPFSVARQMIAAREDAKRKRLLAQQQQSDNPLGGHNNDNFDQQQSQSQSQHPLDDLMFQVQLQQKQKLNPSINWIGKFKKQSIHSDSKNNPIKNETLYHKRKRRYEQQKQYSASNIIPTTTTTTTTFSSPTTNARIPSLFQICLSYIIQNFSEVESLGLGIDTQIRYHIMKELTSKNLMNGYALDVLTYDRGLESLEIIDCTQITQEHLCQVIHNLLPHGLKVLILNHAGRCFGSKAVQAMIDIWNDTTASHNKDNNDQEIMKNTASSSDNLKEEPNFYIQHHDQAVLFALSIGGAYLLTDHDASRLISTFATTLSSIELKACPLLGSELCAAIRDCYSSPSVPFMKSTLSPSLSIYDSYSLNINMHSNMLLELSLEDIPFSKESLNSLVPSKLSSSNSDDNNSALRNLKSLSLKQIDALDDEILHAILTSTNDNLENILISNNIHLTDNILSSIRQCNGNGKLKSLQLIGLKNLTCIGLQTFFAFFTNSHDSRKNDLEYVDGNIKKNDDIQDPSQGKENDFNNDCSKVEYDDDDDTQPLIYEFDISSLPKPPALRKLDLSFCDSNAVTDSVLELALTASACKLYSDVGGSTSDIIIQQPDIIGRLSNMGGMISLNISSSIVTDRTMEIIADTCSTSLKELEINFCPLVSDKGLGYLVSKVGTQFRDLHIWGCAQVTDEFLDGHDRIEEGGLNILGAWMKQSGQSIK